MATTQQISPPVSATVQRGLRVTAVDANSHAERIGLQPGDSLLTLNRQPVNDVIDLWFHSAAERLTVMWQTPLEEMRKATFRKAFHERLGCHVEPFEIRRCANYCVFCFVHQLPPGLRRELYIKDEDYRLSFLYGNYITGTNLTEDDIQRILKLKLSPLFMSVHATQQELRETLLAKKDIAPIIPLMRRLTSRGISLHAQIVLCPGYNDGAELERTVADLATLYPGLESAAIVPLGLTIHRKRLPKLQEVTPQYAAELIQHVSRIQAFTKSQIGYPLVFPSDEFYLIAGMEPPSYAEYPEIPQLANGVGMIYRFYENLESILSALPQTLPRPRRVAAIATDMGKTVLSRLVEGLNKTVGGLTVEILTTTNTLFGEGITVSGLLPGADFDRMIGSHPGYDRYLVPANALRPWDERFLDDMTLSELRAKHSNVEIHAAADTAESFVDACLEAAIS